MLSEGQSACQTDDDPLATPHSCTHQESKTTQAASTTAHLRSLALRALAALGGVLRSRRRRFACRRCAADLRPCTAREAAHSLWVLVWA